MFRGHYWILPRGPEDPGVLEADQQVRGEDQDDREVHVNRWDAQEQIQTKKMRNRFGRNPRTYFVEMREYNPNQ